MEGVAQNTLLLLLISVLLSVVRHLLCLIRLSDENRGGM